MKIGEFIYSHLNPIATTVPINAPMETKLPFITYSIDGQEVTKTITTNGFIENFVSITAYHTEYDKAVDLSLKILKEILKCSNEQNIIGVSYTSTSNAYESEPVDTYSTTLEFSIYER